MRTEIPVQLQKYGEYLDETAPDVDVERIAELAYRVELQPSGRRRYVAGWAIAAVTGLAALLIVGSVVILRSEDPRPAAGGGAPPVLDLEDPQPAAEGGAPPVLGLEEIPPFYAKVSTSLSLAQLDVTMVYEMWYRGEAGWRLASLERQGTGEFIAPGGFEVWTGDLLGQYNPDTNTKETAPGYSNPLDDTGLAAVIWDNFAQECQTLGAGEYIGRTVSRYACVDDELWYDQDSGLMLRRLGGDITHEILELQLNPEFPDGIFTYDPPADARDAAEEQGTGFEHPVVGQPAPPLAGELLGGGTFDLTESLGEPVVVTFWYSACQPCLDHLDVLDQLAPEHADIVFVTALIEDTAADAQPVIDQQGYTLPVLDAPAGQGYLGLEPYIVLGVPTTVFINPDGTIAAVFYGKIELDAHQTYFDQAGW